ncbi:uncharacterized protein BP01DRAFT_367710 [Aspergillus saccharolyticus JOP 1030-1]|uniref:Uncharacterized protein n=1 Tax=Aspergillus saccharolyticus JOP 1030-1 TaxID=1450539 RepID=A0A318Z749_9EURO|nr:hypothetical protein BP01DRAFT_367710 [Aspergillus saccharolyticus JOP 1030-1]PYH42966.1 hypothetical protein BP01DRAFT_367710 [Aspergillus saccharolyticus JOP 1030-1]
MSNRSWGLRIPPELLLEISKYTDDQTLARMAQTCTELRNEFQPELKKRVMDYALPQMTPQWLTTGFVDAVLRHLNIPEHDRDEITAMFTENFRQAAQALSLDLSDLERYLPPQPFRTAIRTDQRKVVEALLRVGGAELANARDHRGEPMLHQAVNCGHPGVVQLLLQHGADVNLEGGDAGRRPLDLRPPLSVRPHIYQILLDAGGMPTSVDFFGLWVHGLPNGAHLLLHAIRNAAAAGEHCEPMWWPIFVVVVSFGHAKFMECIFDQRPDLLNLTRLRETDEEVTLFDVALSFGRYEIAALLVRKGVPLRQAPEDSCFSDMGVEVFVPYVEVWRTVCCRVPEELLSALFERPELEDYAFKDLVLRRAQSMREILPAK